MAGPLSKWERAWAPKRAPWRAWPLPGQALIAFLGIVHLGSSSFTMHRFTAGDYLFSDNQGQNAANYYKEKNVPAQEGKGLNWLQSILGWFSTDLRKLKILSKLLLPPCKVREFQWKQVSKQPRYSAALIPPLGRDLSMCVGPACWIQLPLAFLSGSWATPCRMVSYRLYSFIFRERGSEGEWEKEKHGCVGDTLISVLSHSPHMGSSQASKAFALSRYWTGDVSVFRSMF